MNHAHEATTDHLLLPSHLGRLLLPCVECHTHLPLDETSQRTSHQPLLQRDPLRFWRYFAMASLALNLLLAILLLNQ